MSKFCILLFALCFAYISALKCYRGCPKCQPKGMPKEIVDCDTDAPGSDICVRMHMKESNLGTFGPGVVPAHAMFTCSNKTKIKSSPVCQKDLDTGKCSGVPPEGMSACICACTTDLCNSTQRLNPVGVIMILVGTMLMRFLAQIML